MFLLTFQTDDFNELILTDYMDLDTNKNILSLVEEDFIECKLGEMKTSDEDEDFTEILKATLSTKRKKVTAATKVLVRHVKSATRDRNSFLKALEETEMI